MPFVRVELAVLSIAEGRLQVLLGRRAEAPYAGQWALPGGVLRIDLDADLDGACQRVASERLGAPLPGAQQLCAAGGRRRDPRAPWALSVVYRATLQAADLVAAPGKRLEALKWAPARDAASDPRLAFDHAELIARAEASLRDDVQALQFPPRLLPETFTLTELQSCAEAVLGRTLEKSSFRRRLDDAGTVEPVVGALRTGPHRPAQLFRQARPEIEDLR